MSKKTAFSIAAIGAILLLALVLNSVLDSYSKRVLNLCAIYAIIALSLNLVNGFTGMFSLGQAGFMAIGAYAVAIFTVPVELRAQGFYLEPMHPAIANIELPLIVALLLGGVLAGAFAFVIGFPVLRLRGDYLAIATLGFSEIIRIIFTNTQSITNGALGIKNVPSLSNMFFIYLAAIIVFVLMRLLLSSSFGRAFKAIREDEIVAEAMGINLFKHKIASFVISAFFAGIGGGLYGALLGTVDPKNFMFTLTYNFVLIIVLGGLGSMSGTVIASFIITIGMEWLRFFDDTLILFGTEIPIFRPGLRMVVFSILLMVIVLFFQKGLMGQKELSVDMVKGLVSRVKGLGKKRGDGK
ncbi:MAG: branched-chain amino acid ABC transporter permease [Clostridiales bacterium]|jgi:branched-chain amino acid transport system permease protein|nr:branched-chain amino acid ABC transporter permease [Clostridiales bacterium]MDR2752334.1 branched-chain amino acid ABC transporter permease [Clostridiales bacterium]